MENQNKIGWAFSGVRTQAEFSQEEINELLSVSFDVDRKFSLMLCGEEIPERDGTLEEMEAGLILVKSGMEDYTSGDYAIIAKHGKADLLFIPIELDSTEEMTKQDA